MLTSLSKQFAISLLAAGCFAALSPAALAQDSSITRITPVPDWGNYYVDGANFQHATSFAWPKGSKHTLFAPDSSNPFPNTKYVFRGWKWSGSSISSNPAVITADPAITEYQALFDVQFGVNILFNNCDLSNPTSCASPGTVTVNGSPLTASQQLYFGAGAVVTLQASPNPCWVFVGWGSGTTQLVTGFQNMITVNAPMSVFAQFAPARRIDFATIPANLSLLIDRAAIPTPNSLDWGTSTVHTVAPISPQSDLQGIRWVFSSWSDGGAATHAYTVDAVSTPASLTATFIPGVAVNLLTSPQGLNLTVDGRVNWPSYLFTWGTGESHTIEAPARQTDSSGRVWQFSGWSNTSDASQVFTVPSDATSIAQGVRLIATYAPLGHAILSSAVSGVTLKVDGVDCASPCDILRPIGQQVTVSAPASVAAGADSRQDFAGWSNGARGDLVLTLASDTAMVTANYRLMNFLAASSNPRGAVAFSMQPNSPDGYYDAQARVTVSAAPQPGFRFRGWSGDLSGSAPVGLVSMESPRAVQAMVDRVPYVSPAGVQNGAGLTPQQVVAAGSIVSIFGVNLATDTFLGQGSPLTQTLGGVTVRLGDRLLPLMFVSPTQINLQLPSDVPAGTQTLVVSSAGQPDVSATFTIVADAPGLFPQSIDGQTYALAVHADGSPVTPAAPAAIGEAITVYGTGLGATQPNRPDGFALPASPMFLLQDVPTVQLGGVAQQSLSAYALPGAIGVDAVRFLVGDDVPPSANAQLTLTVGGQPSNTLLLPIK